MKGAPRKYNEPTVSMSIRMPKSLYDRLTRRAERRETSKSFIAVDMLRAAFKKLEEKRSKTFKPKKRVVE